MANNNETVADIVREMRAYAKNSKVNGGEVDVWNWLADYADRIEAAHNHELDVQYGRISRLVDKLAAKDAEIAELRECLKIIRDNILPHTIKSADGKYVNNGGYLSEEFVDDERWRKALEGANNEGK